MAVDSRLEDSEHGVFQSSSKPKRCFLILLKFNSKENTHTMNCSMVSCQTVHNGTQPNRIRYKTIRVSVIFNEKGTLRSTCPISCSEHGACPISCSFFPHSAGNSTDFHPYPIVQSGTEFAHYCGNMRSVLWWIMEISLHLVGETGLVPAHKLTVHNVQVSLKSAINDPTGAFICPVKITPNASGSQSALW